MSIMNPPGGNRCRFLTTSSSSSSWTTRREAVTKTTTNDDDDDDEKKPSNKQPSVFESAVRQVTGNTEYQFGDIAKQSISTFTGKEEVEGGGFEYEIGDISKRAATIAGRAILQNETYQFGDLTRSTLSEMDAAVEDWKDHVVDAVGLSSDNPLGQLLEGLDPRQRLALLVQLVQYGAVAVLTWGLVANLCTTGTLAVAWTSTCYRYQTTTTTTSSTVRMLPGWLVFVSSSSSSSSLAYQQQHLLSTYTSMRLLLDPVFLVTRALGTLFGFGPYLDMVMKMQKKVVRIMSSPETPPTARSSSSSSPPVKIIHRIVTLGLMFSLTNILLPVVLSTGSLLMGGWTVRLIRTLLST